MAQTIQLSRRRPVPRWRAARERFLYLANPFRSLNRCPAFLRDNGVWESIWRAADPLRHRYWQMKNARHRHPLPALPVGGRPVIGRLRADGLAVIPGLVPSARLEALRATARSYALAKAGVDVDAPRPGQQFHLNNLGNELGSDDAVFDLLRAPEIGAIAAHFLGFNPRLRRLALFLNLPQADRTGHDNDEKHFHVDAHDFRVLKLFIYLSDVASENGPFTYVKGTQFDGDLRRVLPRLPSPIIGTREMERYVPPERWVEALGPAGTAFFAETSGVHRGGRTREGHRLMLVAEYSSHRPWESFDHELAEDWS